MVDHSAVARPLKLFYVYSHKDEQLRDRLGQQLKALERTGMISGWHDRRIGPGDEWDSQIDEKLELADIILLLVSADFVSSNYVWEVELKKALERHGKGKACVVPVILRPCQWKNLPFAKLQAVPKDGKPIVLWKNKEAALDDVAESISRIAGTLLASPRHHESLSAKSSELTTEAVHSREILSPFSLNTGERIRLPDLVHILRKTGEPDIPLLVIFGSGRLRGGTVPRSSGRPALATDALFLPEVIVSISETLQPLHTQVKSALDIDVLDASGNCDLQILGRYNLLLSGTGEVNCVTGAVFEFYEKIGLPIRPGCREPYSPYMIGVNGRHFEKPGLGLLVACANPWNRQYISIIAAGFHSAGTVGAMYLLHKYLTHEGKELDNNSQDKTVPGRIFDAARRKYACKDHLFDADDLEPPEDVRNISEDFRRWEFKE